MGDGLGGGPARTFRKRRIGDKIGGGGDVDDLQKPPSERGKKRDKD